jgi:chemotaxis protein MotB
MIKRVSIGLLILMLSTSCVSKKIYNDLESKFTDLKKENRSLADENADLVKAKNQLELDRDALKTDLSRSKSEEDKLKADYAAVQNKLKVYRIHMLHWKETAAMLCKAT